MKNKKKLIKRRWIVAGVILLVILAAAASLYIWQQENIKAAANARKYTQAELQQQLQDSRGSVQETLDQHPEITVRDLNEEERQALRRGEISQKELIALLTGANAGASAPEATPPENPAETPEPAAPTAPQPTDGPTAPAPTPTAAPTTPPPTETPHEPTQQELYEMQLSELVAQVYVMREQYTAQLDAMVAQAKAEYKAMPESERTKSKLISWASGYVAAATEMERQCDAEIRALAAEMRELITANGGDTSIVDQIVFSYAEEKSIQKSLYIQELEKRGLMS